MNVTPVIFFQITFCSTSSSENFIQMRKMEVRTFLSTIKSLLLITPQIAMQSLLKRCYQWIFTNSLTTTFFTSFIEIVLCRPHSIAVQGFACKRMWVVNKSNKLSFIHTRMYVTGEGIRWRVNHKKVYRTFDNSFLSYAFYLSIVGALWSVYLSVWFLKKVLDGVIGALVCNSSKNQWTIDIQVKSFKWN